MIKEKKVELQDNAEVRITITVPREEVRGAYDGLVGEYCKKAQIPGFRRGKVPPDILIRKLGPALLEETEESLLKKSFEEALKDVEKKPLPYSTPHLVHDKPPEAKDVPADSQADSPPPAPPPPPQPQEERKPLSLEEDFTFTIAYDAYPDVQLGEYRGIEIEKPECEILEEDVQRELKGLQEQNALVVEKKDGVVEKGNVVTITFVELEEDGGEKRETKREGFSFEVGTGYNLYSLDEDILGMKVGEQRVVAKSLPEDYQYKELAGKSVKVKALVGSIREKSLPPVDDDLAQDISDKFQTLEDLKVDIRARLEESAKAAVRSRMVAQILDVLYQTSKVPLPRSMVGLQLASNWQSLVRQLRGNERAADEYLEAQGRTREGMIEQWKPEAERRLKSSLVVISLMEKEKIEATDEDVAARIKEIAERRGSSEEEVRGRVESEDAMDEIKGQIRERKLEDFLLAAATVKQGKRMSFLDLVQGNQ